MRHQDTEMTSEILFESSFLWHSIHVGDQVHLEADLEQSSLLQLHADTGYEVLSKQEVAPGHSVFIVQSDITGELIQVHPYLICGYSSREVPVQHC